jgi:hypothetical protein
MACSTKKVRNGGPAAVDQQRQRQAPPQISHFIENNMIKAF